MGNPSELKASSRTAKSARPSPAARPTEGPIRARLSRLPGPCRASRRLLRSGDFPGALALRIRPQVLLDHRAVGLKRRLQHCDRGIRIVVAAHEDVERGVIDLRP